MKTKHILSVMLALVMMATIFAPVVSAADSRGIDLNASIKESTPEVAITVDTEAIDFGELLPGETSSSHPVKVTNVGLKDVDVNVEAADDAGQEAVFAPGLLINEAEWGEYATTLVADAQDDLDVALHVPSDVTTRGAIGGSLTVWAEEHVVPAPTAAFSAAPLSGEAPLTVQFTDESVGATAWQWDFDNDGTVDSYDQNPTYTYNTPGTYTVKLIVSNDGGSDDAVKIDYITVMDVPAERTWELFQGNQQLTGYYDGVTPDSNATKWISEAIGAKPSSSVVIAEGKVFVYCFDEGAGYVAALDLGDGTLLWKKKCSISNPYFSWATPAYHDGLIFMHGDFARYASNGEPAWSRRLPDNTNGGPMIAEGKVFIGNWDGHNYYAYNEKTGQWVWEFNAGGYCQGTPAYHEGKLFITSWLDTGGNIYCLNATDGTLIWHSTTPLDTCGSPMVANGFVYVTTYNFGGDGDLYCFYESNGTQVWRQTIQRTDSTPTYYDGKVYVTGGCYGFSEHQTYCFNAFDGTPIWSTTPEQDIGGWTSSVVVSADGKVFVGREGAWSEAGGMSFGYLKLFALDAEDGTVLWETENGGGTVAIYDGVVFTADIDGRIYAYGPGGAT